MTKTEPRPSCMFRKRPMQQRKRGSKLSMGITGAASQTRQCQTSNTPAPLLETKTLSTRKSRLGAPQLQAQLSRLTDRTRHRRLKNTQSSPKELGSRLRGSKTCTTRISPTRGSTTWTREREVSWRGKTTSPTCRKDLETRRGKDMACAICVAPSWTHSWNMENPAALAKPHEDTTHAFAPRCVD